MRRAGALGILVLIVAGLVVAANVFEVRVNVDVGRSDLASASPFWKEQPGEAELPPALGIWVQLAKSLKPAVVNVSSSQGRDAPGDDFFRRFFGGPQQGPPDRERMSLGSGFIVSADGYVVTNFHVVQEAAAIIVRLADQSEHRAKLVGSDPRTDIALLKIDARNLRMIPFGDSNKLEVGEPVMAIGNPFGLDQTVTTGIVSAKERFIGTGPYDDFIQIDASINPGNSGGPLIDARGALVGINTAIFSQGGGWSGIGFAIPVNLAKDVLSQLRERGTVTRGYLGVAVVPVTPDAAKSTGVNAGQGALVAEVVSGSPASRAGIKPGDIIVAFQGNGIQDPHDLTRRVAGTPPGTEVKLDVARQGDKRAVSAKLDRLPDQPPARTPPRGR
ncbi:MAG: Do family serine endopeptidase [Candidatus Rokubacteria bacterium]|nr:Do family serine endopeptidase [Candidatus Rokubacteria bacterium]